MPKPATHLPTTLAEAQEWAAARLAANRAVFGAAVMEATAEPTGHATDQGGDEPSARSLEEVVAELGLTPEQVAGRLAASRKWEARAKASDTVARADYDQVVQERDALRQQAETETEKAVREAREEGLAAGRQEAAAAAYRTTVTTLLRAGLRGAGVAADELEEIVAEANLDAFRAEDGTADDEKVARFVKRNAGTAGASGQWPDMGQDRRGVPAQKRSLWDTYGKK